MHDLKTGMCSKIYDNATKDPTGSTFPSSDNEWVLPVVKRKISERKQGSIHFGVGTFN